MEVSTGLLGEIYHFFVQCLLRMVIIKWNKDRLEVSRLGHAMARKLNKRKNVAERSNPGHDIFSSL